MEFTRSLIEYSALYDTARSHNNYTTISTSIMVLDDFSGISSGVCLTKNKKMPQNLVTPVTFEQTKQHALGDRGFRRQGL